MRWKLSLVCLLVVGAGSTLASAAVTTSAVTSTAPTATITAATGLGKHSAVLHATVLPNGADTLYYFSYGPTSALGASSNEKLVDATQLSQSVSAVVRGLAPGTRYFYDLHGMSSAGQVSSAIASFTTRGTPSTRPITGAAIVTGRTTATLTGVVDPAHALTTYSFQVDTASGQPVKTTAVRSLAPGAHPVRVALRVSGLSPLTRYFYNLVSTTGTRSVSGTGQTFETFPSRPLLTSVVAHTTPKLESVAPYTFATQGRVPIPASVLKPLACTGTATVNAYDGTTRVSHLLAPLTTSCTFAAATIFDALPVVGPAREQLRIYVRFTGNRYLRAVSLKPTVVTLTAPTATTSTGTVTTG
jgi:phosphodiesterase/alkaline phosphatase D-like protein